jgi:hypothetical protein
LQFRPQVDKLISYLQVMVIDFFLIYSSLSSLEPP